MFSVDILTTESDEWQTVNTYATMTEAREWAVYESGRATVRSVEICEKLTGLMVESFRGAALGTPVVKCLGGGNPHTLCECPRCK